MHVRKKCLQCGRYYEAQRSTSKYCSDKCRKDYHRADQVVISTSSAIKETRELMNKLDALSVVGEPNQRPLYAHFAEALAIAFREVGM